MKNTNKSMGAIISCLFYLLSNIYSHYEFVPLKTFFIDDIALFKQFKSVNFIQYLLEGHDYKFRPISDFFLYLGYIIFGTNTTYAWIYIIFIGAISSLVVYYVIYNLCIYNKTLWGIIGSIFFSITRFSYYTVGQYFGITESITIIFAILSLYWANKFLSAPDTSESKYYIYMHLCVLLTIFSREQHLMLYGFIIVTIFVKKIFNIKASLKYYVTTILSAIIVLVFRSLYMGDMALQGTSGSNLFSSINIPNIFKYFIQGIFLILGWNVGPDYLNGVNYRRVLPIINIMPLIILLLLIPIIIYIIKKNKSNSIIIKKVLLFSSFIILSLLSGCITLRLELRWVYIPYIAFINMILYILSNEKISINLSLSKIFTYDHVIIFSTSISIIIAIFMGYYYRSKWNNNYLGTNYQNYNNAYEVTIGKYGNSLIGKKIVFIDNNITVLDPWFTSMIFDVYCGEDTVQLYYYENISDIPTEILNSDSIIIYGDNNTANIWLKSFYDITDIVK